MTVGSIESLVIGNIGIVCDFCDQVCVFLTTSYIYLFLHKMIKIVNKKLAFVIAS